MTSTEQLQQWLPAPSIAGPHKQQQFGLIYSWEKSGNLLRSTDFPPYVSELLHRIRTRCKELVDFEAHTQINNWYTKSKGDFMSLFTSRVVCLALAGDCLFQMTQHKMPSASSSSSSPSTTTLVTLGNTESPTTISYPKWGSRSHSEKRKILQKSNYKSRYWRNVEPIFIEPRRVLVQFWPFLDKCTL